jgi:hypothetical protein
VESLGGRVRLRLIPAVITAIGVSLLAAGLMSYTTAVPPSPSGRPFATYEPPPSLDTGPITLPGASAPPSIEPTFPADRVATRIVVRRMGIDLPVVLQTSKDGGFPLCDVAMYFKSLGQPGEGRATYVYAHARDGMFLPLLEASQRNNGARMLGMTVEVYTSDSWLYVYSVTDVRRHQTSLEDAVNAQSEQLWLQTSEGPIGTSEKLQVIAQFLSASPTDFKSAHPKPRPRVCG